MNHTPQPVAIGVDGSPSTAGAIRVELETLRHEWRTTYPSVGVEIRIVHDQPAHALVHASREADLLVLVRHAHGFPTGALGGSGRAVLRDAECPVRIVPLGAVPAVAGLVLELAGDVAT